MELMGLQAKVPTEQASNKQETIEVLYTGAVSFSGWLTLHIACVVVPRPWPGLGDMPAGYASSTSPWLF